jgi:hypothetical protein
MGFGRAVAGRISSFSGAACASRWRIARTTISAVIWRSAITTVVVVQGVPQYERGARHDAHQGHPAADDQLTAAVQLADHAGIAREF